MPLKLLETDEFIKSKCEQLTFRTISTINAHVKDIVVFYDKESNLTWSQQFAVNYENLLLDVQMQSVFDDFNTATNMIHIIYANILQTLQETSTQITTRLTSSYFKACL